MIALRCTHCAKTLEIEDAFAGGVVRCQYCGTIQTVPASAAGNAEGKMLIREGQMGSASGLDDLADVISSGGMSSGLRQKRKKKHPEAVTLEPRQSPIAKFIVASLAVLGIGLAAVAVIFILNAGKGGDDESTAASSAATPVSDGPRFLDASIRRGNVAYVIDRGESTRDYMNVIADAVAESIETLSADAEFQGFFWSEPGRTPPPLPGKAKRSTLSVNELRKAINDAPAGGATEATTAIASALDAGADTVVLITGKGWQLDEVFAEQAAKTWAGRPARLLAVSLGSVDSPAMKNLATRVGGKYVSYDSGTLRKLLPQ